MGAACGGGAAELVPGGLGPTDMLYYASGSLGIRGAMITASHNPAKYNGIKLCREGARPVGSATGLAELRTMAESGIPGAQGAPESVVAGTITARDLLSGYAALLKTLVDLS